MNWLVTGLIVGAAVGIAGAAIFATGGLAAAAIIGGAAATGGGLMEFASTLSSVDKEVVGAISAVGSGNVFANGLASARAHLDSALCSKHPAPAIIATGSGTVFINSMPAARVDDTTICSAVITSGSGNVYIGGPTVQTDVIEPENLVPPAVHVAMFVVGIGSALVLAAPAVVAGGLVLGVAGGFGGNWAGGKIFGEGSDGQKLSALAGSILGGFLGAKSPRLLPSARPPVVPPVAPPARPPAVLPAVPPARPPVVPPAVPPARPPAAPPAGGAGGPRPATSAASGARLRESMAKKAGIPRDIHENPSGVWGSTLDDLKRSFAMDGATVTDKAARASSSGNAQIFLVEKSPTGITQVQFSPASNVSTHKGQYYKLTYGDGSKVKIIDPVAYRPSFVKGGEPLYDKNTVYLNPQGEEVIFSKAADAWVKK